MTKSLRLTDYQYRSTQSQYAEECTLQSLGELLPDYAVGLLEDSASEEVGDHLLDCLHCRETYLMMLCVERPRLRERAPSAAAAPPPAPDAANYFTGAKVVNMADFKRRRF